MPSSQDALREFIHEDGQRQTMRTGLADWAAQVLAPSGRLPATHHRLLLAELERVARTQSDRLIVLMPPGAAKSTYTSVIFPAWWLAQFPSSSIIAASHTAGLAEFFSRQVRGLIAADGSRLSTLLQADNRSVRSWRLSTGGQYYATGLRGPIAGRRADLIVIDDPVKSRMEADNAGARDLTWNWYRFDLVTRLTPGGRIVLVMTRWHEDDLGGRLIAQNSGEWRVVRLPALSETDDPLARSVGAPLWPEWEDAPALLRKRETMGTRAWSALFQQSPQPLDGALFKVERVVYLDFVPDLHLSHPIRAWDLAATSKADDNDPDWTVGLKLHRDAAGRFVVLDVVRLRATPWEVERLMVDTARRDGPSVLVCLPQDPGSAGKVVATNYTAKLAGFHVSVSPETGSKVTRATPIAAQLEAGNLAVVRAEWNNALIEEMREFPHGRKDDQVDALSRGFAWLVSMAPPPRKLSVSFVAR